MTIMTIIMLLCQGRTRTTIQIGRRRTATAKTSRTALFVDVITLCLVITVVGQVVLAGRKENDNVIDRIVSRMTLDQKIGQMSQLDVRILLQPCKSNNQTTPTTTTTTTTTAIRIASKSDPHEVLSPSPSRHLQQHQHQQQQQQQTVQVPQLCLNQTALEYYIGRLGIGSILNTVDDIPWTARTYRHIMQQIQQTAADYHHSSAVLWGIDSVHGANYIHNATITPQPINVAATFNVTTAYQAGAIASRDTRAAGIQWLFSPLVGLAIQPRWSRVYETFGEDPILVGVMATALIRGIQHIDLDPKAVPARAAACAKHFIGYSMPRTGHDRSPAWIPTRHLYQYFVPPWRRVIQQAQVMSIMESYSEIDGVPVVSNPALIQSLLRQHLQFTDGVLLTDHEEIRHLYQWHGVARDAIDATQHVLQSVSVDVSMIPWDAEGFRDAIRQGLTVDTNDNHNNTKRRAMFHQGRIDASVRRILKLKQQLGLLDSSSTSPSQTRSTSAHSTDTEELHSEPFLLPTDDPNLDRVGGDEAAVMDTVRQSLILTKNDHNTLPLGIPRLAQGTVTHAGGSAAATPTATTNSTQSTFTRPRKLSVLVTGPTSHSRIYQSGGWTWQWSGAPSEDWFTYGTTVLEAATQEPDWDVSYRCGVNIVGLDCQPNSIAEAAYQASQVDVVILCIGEEAYTEKPGDIRSLDLPMGQYDLFHAIRAQTNATIILVYFGGRPRLLRGMVDQADAVIVAFLPGPSAGEAIIDLLMGRFSPSGRLPVTYPLEDDNGGLPYFHPLSDQCTNGEGPLPHKEFVPCSVQWPFGHGLSYTTFHYSNLNATGNIGQDMHVSVKVKNTGSMDGAEVILFFTFDDFRRTTPEYKRLRAFEKVYLTVGEEITVNATIHADEWQFVGPNDDRHYIMDSTMTGWIGVGAATDCRAHDNNNELCIRWRPNPVTATTPTSIMMTMNPPACTAACQLWRQSGCSDLRELTESSCLAMCMSVNENAGNGIQYNMDGWGWNYVNCLESVLHGFLIATGSATTTDLNFCWKMTTLCRDIFRTGSMDEFGFGNSTEIVPLSDIRSATTITAWICSFVSAAMIIYWIRGGSLQKKTNTHEV